GVAVAPYIYLYILREIRFKQFSNLLPEAVDLMSRGLRAGHSISAVLEMVGNEIAEPIGSEFRGLQGEQSLGLPMRDSLRNLVNHNYEKPLFTDPFGIKMLYFGLGMMVIGILAIRKIIDIEV